MTSQTNAQRLAEYEVTVLFDASSTVTVMAESPEDAAEKAEDLTSGNQHLCHQCSNTLETGDAIGCLVYEGGELVAETDWKSKRITDLEADNAQLRAELERLQKESEAVSRDAERIDGAIDAACAKW